MTKTKTAKFIPLPNFFILFLCNLTFLATNAGATGSVPSPTPMPTSCSDVCSAVVDSSGNPIGLSGGTWSASDDLWCANHGVQTNNGVAATALATQTNGCNIAIASGEDCTAANQKLRHCKVYSIALTGQNTSYCMAYETAYQAEGLNIGLLALDITAAGTCAASCFTPGGLIGGGVGGICAAAGGIAGITEIVGVFKMQDPTSTTGKALADVAGAAGIGLAAVNAKYARDAYQAGKTAAKEEGEKALEDEALSKGKKISCIASAALYSAMAGFRVYNLTQMSSIKDSACTNVQKLMSTALAHDTSTGSSANNGINAGGSSDGGASGGSTGVNGTTGGSSISPAQNMVACPNDPAQLCASQSAAQSIDGGSLVNSGLDHTLAPQAQALLDHGLGKQAKSGAGAGAMMSGATGGALGDFGAALARVADAAQKNPNDLASLIPNISSVMSGGGGAGSGGAKADDSLNAIMSAFGGGAAAGGGGVQGPGLASFGTEPITDIWHTKTNENLFQIISNKISKVTNRIR
jgi:hypothetical protein